MVRRRGTKLSRVPLRLARSSESVAKVAQAGDETLTSSATACATRGCPCGKIAGPGRGRTGLQARLGVGRETGNGPGDPFYVGSAWKLAGRGAAGDETLTGSATACAVGSSESVAEVVTPSGDGCRRRGTKLSRVPLRLARSKIVITTGIRFTSRSEYRVSLVPLSPLT
jgi:hypothetical protein